MKRFILTLTAIFICTIAYAHTINWLVGNTILETTTCDSGESITPPTAPYKYGYHFVEWAPYSARIEYLESTGTQYIDTGVVANETTEAEIEFSNFVSNSGENILFMTTNNNWSNENFGINLSITNGLLLFYMNCDGWTTNTLSNIKGNIKLSLTGIYLNNRLLTITRGKIPSSSTFSTRYPIFIFGQNNRGKIEYTSKYRLQYFKLWQDYVLVRDFIPVLDPDGTPCLYDKVEHKFYYNAGTGDFIAGPVIVE